MTIKVASAQYPIARHETLNDWKTYTEKWVKSAVDQQADLLVFPEYGSMELVSILAVEVQQDLHLQIAEMQQLLPAFREAFTAFAKKYNVIIVAPSFPVKVEDRYFNRAYVYSPKGEAGYQDKLFMTRFENEEWGIHSAPKQLTVFEAEWGKFGIQICYDSEFALGTHHLAEHGIDLVLVPSCTETIRGAARVHVGSRARAMEQQVYAVVAQTVGNAQWSPAVDINYGYTGFYATPDKQLPEEGIIATGIPQAEEWQIIELDFDLIKLVREDGQVLNFKDHRPLVTAFRQETIRIVTTQV
ncbi:MAG: carbon-nitrogen hydrolase family protein [Crocinitomicaceae bacterium]|nr:carbon-nitrogen hydrolase family protein [Crocinitomicaceae bacterium]NGF75322.1 carbon-nitrogen hydrolase family protein [Fluviicola sp. SGL-29]